MTGIPDARMVRIAPVSSAARGPNPAPEVCRACVGALSVSGASLMVITDGVSAPLAWSDPVGGQLEELQLTLGEGPCRDAHEMGHPVAEPDLAHPRRARWLAFGPAALEAGAAAVFSYPLRIGGVRLGALTLYQTSVGHLSAEQHADARVVASLALDAILIRQAGAAGGTLSPDLEMLMDSSATLHQACGMVSVQLGVGVGEGLIRLRARAFSENRTVAHVAADVVARRLRLEG